MKLGLVAIIAMAAIAEERTIPSAEQMARLLVGERVITSPLCTAAGTRISIKFRVQKDGTTKDVSENKRSRLAKVHKIVKGLARKAVEGWKFKEPVIGGRSAEFRSWANLECFPPTARPTAVPLPSPTR
jgi:hypothetical protein